MAIRILLIALLIASPCFGATYYIDPSSGTDGAGTEGDPYNTLTGKSFSTSDDLYFKRGTTYTGNSYTWATSGTAEDRCVIGAYGTGSDPIWALPSGQNQALYFAARNYITIQNVMFTGGNDNASGRILNFATACHDITIDS